jgi:N utilization substance protein B
MQALYSYQVTQESLKQVIHESLVEKYALDPAQHDFTEKETFEKHQKKISSVFLEHLKDKKVPTDTGLEASVMEDIQAAMDDYFTKIDAERRSIKKQMIKQADQIYAWYIMLLLLPGELAFLESQEKEKHSRSNTQKATQSHYPLYEGDFIQKLNTTTALQQYSLDHNLTWKAHTDELRNWYKELIKRDELYQELAASGADTQAQIDFLLHFYKQVFFKSDLTLQFMTEQLLSWEDDAPILRNMLTKTLKSFDPEIDKEVSLRPLSINKEDDFDYFERLFSETINYNDQVEKYIRKKTKNWDVKRISATDIIILKMALTEMIIFPSIPVKVTINEFIEISKQYSTPKSKQFINGILDVLANELNSEGIVKKSGRGLIDNK